MVAAMLQAHEGNLHRTSRETGVPVNTVKNWKDKWEREGYPENIQELLPAVAGDFLDTATNLRWEMVERLAEKVRKDQVSPAQLVAGISMLTDKINVMKGLATSRTENVQIAATDPKELAKELASYVATAVDAAQERNDVIEDAEWTEQAPRALSAA